MTDSKPKCRKKEFHEFGVCEDRTLWERFLLIFQPVKYYTNKDSDPFAEYICFYKMLDNKIFILEEAHFTEYCPENL